MRDYLNRFDPMPLQLGAVVRPKPEPTAEQKRIAAYKAFAAMSDKLTAKGAANGDAMVSAKQPEADSEGWIKWEGVGSVPIRPGQEVAVRLRCGRVLPCTITNQDNWRHIWGDGDIIAYRLIQEPKKPEADEEGWVKHDGKGLPEALCGKSVELLYGDGEKRSGKATNWVGWDHTREPLAFRIVAYRVIG